MQQGQVFELKKRAVDGSPVWAYRYRTDGPGSRRLQRGGFSSERDAAEALERALEHLRRQKGVGSTLTLKELVEDAKKRPGEIVFTSSGLYGAAHIPMEMFIKAAGIKMRHLPTTGGGPMMNAMLGGHAQAVMTPVSLAAAHVKAGKLRLLAHSGTAPVASFPDVPSFKAQGYDVEYTAWAGLVAPKGTPPHVIKILRDAMREVVKSPEVVSSHAKFETPVAYMDADEFNAWWAKDAARLAEVVKQIGKVE